MANISRYTSFSYSYTSRLFFCYINQFFFLSLAFYANMLSIMIIYERLSMFVLKYTKFHTKQPYERTRLLFIICCLINLIVCFNQQAKGEDEFIRHKNDLNLLMNLNKCDSTEFGTNLIVRFITGIALIIDNL